MLTIIPPKNSSIAITSNSDISTWDTDADIVLDRNLNQIYFLDKAGCVTEDATQAKSIYWAEPAKGGHRITYYQQPYDASQAYQQGDLVEKDGKIYRSNKNDNVWSPEAHLGELWSEIAELEAEKNSFSTNKLCKWL